MKALLDSGAYGSPLIAHCAHRAATVPESYTDTIAIIGTVIHEIDCMSWLMGDYFTAVQVIKPRKNTLAHAGQHDPQVVIFITSTGMLVEVEVNVNCQYGYDIQCEVVAERGILRLPEPARVFRREGGTGAYAITNDGLQRFAESYDAEVQAWVSACNGGTHSGGPDAWSGYCAAVVSDAALKAQATGEIVPIPLTDRPDFYK